MSKILRELFTKLEDIIFIDEIAYLAIENGELIPIFKRDSKLLSNEEWVDFHREYRSFVKDSRLLIKLVNEKTVCAVKDTDQLPKKPIEFEKLGIKSIYLFPIVKDNQAVGIVDIAYIDKCHELTIEQLNRCEEIIKEYENSLSSVGQV